ncbi:MAG: hypothetical protein ACJ8LG_20835 [Massilia sp.]
MGNSLHNKIYLGRTSLFSSRPLLVALAVGALASVGLALLRALR